MFATPAGNAERKAREIDWEERERELVALCDRFRSTNGSYDCLVPGSGGKDSFYQSWVLKYKYGMNPLTITWAPNIYTEWGRHNFDAWIHSGMDNYTMTASGRSKRLLTRLPLKNIFHPFQPFIIGQKCFAPKMAIQFNIPLVFYGENEAEYGNPISDNAEAQRSFDYFASSDEEELFIGGESRCQPQGQFRPEIRQIFRPICRRIYVPSRTWVPRFTISVTISSGTRRALTISP